MNELIKLKKNKVEVSIRIVFFEENRKSIAYTPSLELSGEGGNANDAMEDLKSILKITFEECIVDNTFNEMLSELGWRKVSEREREHPAFDVKKLKRKLPPPVKTRLENLSFATSASR